MFNEDVAVVGIKKNSRLKFINTKGQRIGSKIDKVWRYTHGTVNDGFILLRKDSLIYNYLNIKTRKYLFDTNSENSCTPFKEGMAKVWLKNSRTYGYFNTNGELVIDNKYDKGSDFYNGFACVQINGEFQYINKKGKVVYKFK